MFKILQQPYPFVRDIKKTVRTNFIIGCFIALFLIVFQPFGTTFWHDEYKVIKLAGYGLVAFLIPTLFSFFLFKAFSVESLEDRWTVGKELSYFVIILMSIAFFNLLYSNLLGMSNFSFDNFIGLLTAVLLLGSFPITASVYLKFNSYKLMNEKTAANIDQELKSFHENQVQQKETQNIILIAENQKDEVILDPREVLYIESTDNYSTIVISKENQIQKKLIRSSLKRIENQITNEFIIRCHRSFIVNLDRVKNISGNAQGYRLTIENLEEKIPVARNYANTILELLKNNSIKKT